eukprot:3442568-Alexandrium_andersonii.AAC.1
MCWEGNRNMPKPKCADWHARYPALLFRLQASWGNDATTCGNDSGTWRVTRAHACPWAGRRLPAKRPLRRAAAAHAPRGKFAPARSSAYGTTPSTLSGTGS